MAAVGARAGIWRAGGSGRMAGTAGSAGNCAGAGGISGRGVATGNLGLVEAAIPGRRGQIPAAGGALRVAGRFSGFAGRDPAMCSAQRGDQRRRLQHLAEDSREHPADARLDSEDASADFAFAASGERRGLRYAAQRPVRDSCALGASAECSGCGTWSERNRADSVRGAV